MIEVAHVDTVRAGRLRGSNPRAGRAARLPPGPHELVIVNATAHPVDSAYRAPRRRAKLPVETIMRMARRAALADFLSRGFQDVDDMRVFVRQDPRQGDKVVRALPDEDQSLAGLATLVVDALAVRGLLDEEFFDRLTAEFPLRADDIQPLRDAWLGHPDAVEAVPPTPVKPEITESECSPPASPPGAPLSPPTDRLDAHREAPAREAREAGGGLNDARGFLRTRDRLVLLRAAPSDSLRSALGCATVGVLGPSLAVVTGIVAVASVCAGVVGLLAFDHKTAVPHAAMVTRHTWKRTIGIEAVTATTGAGWCTDVPSDASVARRSQKEQDRHRGFGNSTVIEYAEWCEWTGARWAAQKGEEASGEGMEPSWPELHLTKTDCSTIGCQREGRREEALTLNLDLADGDTVTCKVAQEVWLAIADGAQVYVKLGGVLNQPQCATVSTTLGS